MKRIVLLFSLIIVFLTSVEGQDIHFSQFYLSPLNLNPALTGVNSCKIRLVANYRNQWASVAGKYAFNTYSVSYDQRIPVGRSDYFGFGASFWGDKAGHSEFSTLQARLSGSFQKKMGGYRSRASYLVVGADIGITQRSINFQNLLYGNNWDPGTNSPDPSIGGEFGFDRGSFIFADIAGGLLWFTTFDARNNLYVGAAYHHINQANLSFREDAVEELYSKITAHVGGEFEISSRTRIVPGIVTFFQGPSFELNAGASLKFILGKFKNSHESFQAGIWYRVAGHESQLLTGDAIILSTRFEYDNYSIGFSYDLNTSSLRAASKGNGAFEFSMIYNICGPERRNTYCPRF